MSLREFTDEAGVKWEVWDVRPASLSGTFAPAATTISGGHFSSLGPVQESYAGGWLCFSRGDVKRRLAPIPSDWHLSSDVELQGFWRDAIEVAPVHSPHEGRLGPAVLNGSSQQILSELISREPSQQSSPIQRS
jgi:hypothetical protein